MLNRRHLRVKVLQTLYAYNQSDEKQVAKFEKSLLKSVDQVYEMYIWVLNLLIEVADYTAIDAEGRARKFLPSENDLNSNLRLQNNPFIASLRLNGRFIDHTKKYHVSWAFDPEITREIFQKLKTTDEYKSYLVQDDHSIAAEKDIIKFIFKKIDFLFKIEPEPIQSKGVKGENALQSSVTFVSQFHKILTITQFFVNISARIKDYIRIKKDRLI